MFQSVSSCETTSGWRPVEHAAGEVLDLEPVLVVAADRDRARLAVGVGVLDRDVIASQTTKACGTVIVALGAEQPHLVAVRLRQAAHELRRLAGAEVEDAAGTPRRRPRGWAATIPLDRDRRPAEHPPRHVDAVGADVVERAAAVLGPAADVRRVAHREREDGRARVRSSPIAPSSSSRRTRCPLGVEAVHERLHPDDAAARRSGRSCRPSRRRPAPPASRTARACRHRRRASTTRRAGGSGAGCRRRRRPESASSSLVGAVQADVELRLAQEGGARIAGARKGDELGVVRPQDRRDHDLAADVGRAHDADPNLRHLGPPRSRWPIVAAGRRARVRCFPEADSVSTPTQSRAPWTILGACPRS